jgi:hypothetical protein
MRLARATPFGVVVRVEGDDTSHPVLKLGEGGQRDRRAHRLARQSDIVDVEHRDELDECAAERRLGVTRARPDVGPAHSGQVDSVDGEGLQNPRDHQLEVIELRADRVQQDQRRPGTRPQVPQARPVGECGVLDLS